jgi:hypothetical protein
MNPEIGTPEYYLPFVLSLLNKLDCVPDPEQIFWHYTTGNTNVFHLAPNRRQLISQVSTSNVPLAAGQQITTLIMPLPPKMSATCTCRVKTSRSSPGGTLREDQMFRNPAGDVRSWP